MANDEMTTEDKVWGGLFGLVILVALVMLLVHWQWTLIIGIGGLVALGLVKLGWDFASGKSEN